VHKANFTKAQDKMIDRRQAMIELETKKVQEKLRPKFARIVADMEQASLLVSTTKMALSTEIKAA